MTSLLAADHRVVVAATETEGRIVAVGHVEESADPEAATDAMLAFITPDGEMHATARGNPGVSEEYRDVAVLADGNQSVAVN